MITLYPRLQNFVKTQITHPCARPWYVWAETFAPAFLELLFTVTLFDVEDAIRAHGESIVREKPGKRGGRKRHTFKTRVTAKATTVDRYAQKGLKTLLVVTSPLEAIGFAWLLYSAVDQFFYNWQTLLEASDFCQAPIESGPLIRSRGPGLISFVVGGVPVILNSVDQNRGGWSSGTLSASLPEGRYSAAFGLTVKGPLSGVNPVWIQLRPTSIFGSTIFRSDDISLGPGEEGSMTVRADFFLPTVSGGSITWEIGGSTIPIGIEAVRGHMFVQRVG